MPMSPDFEDRLYPILPEVVAEFGTPFHIYDETGIREGVHNLYQAFAKAHGFREFFAVKALPNRWILEILLHALGLGFDCSSVPELELVRMVGAGPDDVMFTSNNTAPREYRAALAFGCMLNLDDITFVSKVPRMPELICFRYNPGPSRTGESSIGRPEEAKFGVTRDQIVKAYRLAKDRGAKRFGLHTMLISNEMHYEYMVETVHMLLAVAAEVSSALDAPLEFINIGGGIGIPYRPEQRPFDVPALAHQAIAALDGFGQTHGFRPKLYMECGRLITGPHGVLVTQAINIMEKYRRFVGVDACMSDFLRPGNHNRYHHITVVNSTGAQKAGGGCIVDVVGSLCTNSDKFAKQRDLPPIQEGDALVIHDTGAHGISRGFQYNGRLRPKELLLRQDGTVELIRRHETSDDYFRTQVDFAARTFTPASRIDVRMVSQVQGEVPGTARAIPAGAVSQAARPDDPLAEGAVMARTLAQKFCRPQPGVGRDCAWYHGFWLYLRTMGLSKASGGQTDFLVASLRGLARAGEFPRVLVTGSADYCMPSYALWAYHLEGAPQALTVLDRCETPLALTRWYAERQHVKVDTPCSDVLRYDPGVTFDVVMTNSFLGSFMPTQRETLFTVWARLLRPGGKLLFTNRLRPHAPEGEMRFSSAEVEVFCATARREAARLPRLDVGPDEVAIWARTYAERYVSHPVHSQCEIMQLLQGAGFSVDGLDVVAYGGRVAGPVSGPSTNQRADYVRVLATRL